MANPVRGEGGVVLPFDTKRRLGQQLDRLKAALLERKPGLDAEVCYAEDDEPYLSVGLEGFSAILVTREPLGGLSVVLMGDGSPTYIARGSTEATILYQLLKHT